MKKSLHNHKRMNNIEYIKLLLNVGLILAAFCIKNSKPCEVNACNWTDNVLSKHYSIQLIPNMEKEYTSNGNLVVSIEIRQNTYHFTMDVLNLHINETETFVRNTYSEKYVPKEYHYDNVREILTLHFEEELVKGNYVLVMNFISSSTKDIGFYTKSYMSNEGPQMVAVTQTKGFIARQTFPCWDEPGLKATFNISVKHHKKYKVLSNMPAKEKNQTQLNISETENDVIWTEFETTPRMSTYLVAAVVFDPVHIFNTFTSETVNIWCRPHLLSQIELQFMHDVVYDIIEHLSNYTSFFNVPMINIVILPDSLITNTVSSWGLIIYRESDFVQKTITVMRKRHIANLIAEHVIRHWFGNLITPTKWTWVWLRDGFVTFFKSYILNMIFQDWLSMDMLVAEDIHSALHYDIGYYMTPVVSNNIRFQLSLLENSQYKTQYISLATSAKASAILRMLRFIISDDVFQKGIKAYFTNYAYQSIASNNVWASMQDILIDKYFKSNKQNLHVDAFMKLKIYYDSKISHKIFRINTAMDAYMTKDRYPLVLVKRDYISGKTIISQECFSSKNVNDTKWWIPLTFTTQTNPDFSETSFTWLLPEDENVTLTLKPNDWIIVNLQRYGYYRVNYDKTNWQRIADYLNSDKYVNIHVLNRAQLIDDAFALIRYNKIESSVFLNLTKYLSRETDYIVWHTMFRILAYSSEYFLLSESKNLKSHFSEILGSRLEKLGYEEDSNEHDFTKIERLNATYWACYLGNTKCRSAATSKLINYLDDPENYNILPYWQEWTFCAGLMAANTTIWDKAKDIYFKKSNQRFYEFLACAEEPENIIKYLNIWKTSKNSTLENDDLNVMFNFIVKKHGRNDEILNYILNNFETLIPESLRIKIINQLILNVYSLAQLDRVQNLTHNEFAFEENILAELRDIIEVRRSNLEFLIFLFTSRFLK